MVSYLFLITKHRWFFAFVFVFVFAGETNPIGLTLTGVTNGSAQVGWYQPILGTGETLLGYQVSVVEVTSEDNVDQYTTQDTSTTVENLNPYLEYSVLVAALGTGAVASVFITILEEGGKWCTQSTSLVPH